MARRVPPRVARQLEQEREQNRQQRAQEHTPQGPPPPTHWPHPEYTMPDRDDYVPNPSWVGAPLLEIPSEMEVCPYCARPGVRTWKENRRRSLPYILSAILGMFFALISGGLLAIPLFLFAVLLLWMTRRPVRHYYCPACGAIWMTNR